MRQDTCWGCGLRQPHLQNSGRFQSPFRQRFQATNTARKTKAPSLGRALEAARACTVLPRRTLVYEAWRKMSGKFNRIPRHEQRAAANKHQLARLHTIHHNLTAKHHRQCFLLRDGTWPILYIYIDRTTSSPRGRTPRCSRNYLSALRRKETTQGHSPPTPAFAGSYAGPSAGSMGSTGSGAARGGARAKT